MKGLLILLGGLEISDGIITQFAVGNGLAQEGNPLMASIAMEGNFLSLKIIGALFSVLILWGISKRFPVVVLRATSSIVIFYGAVMTWNLNMLFRA